MQAEELKQALAQRRPDWADALSVEGALCLLTVDRDRLTETATALKALHGLPFHYFSFVTAVDHQDHFEVLYCLENLEQGARLFVRSRAERDDPRMPSLCDVYLGANWHERETFDLLGVVFEGHPDLRRILLPEDFEGHPLRKDYEMSKQAPKFRGLRERGWLDREETSDE